MFIAFQLIGTGGPVVVTPKVVDSNHLTNRFFCSERYVLCSYISTLKVKENIATKMFVCHTKAKDSFVHFGTHFLCNALKSFLAFSKIYRRILMHLYFMLFKKYRQGYQMQRSSRSDLLTAHPFMSCCIYLYMSHVVIHIWQR